MAEISPKRRREEEKCADNPINSDLDASTAKRQKPCNNILNLLDDDNEEEPTQDLSPIFTAFQQQISTTTFDCDSLPSTAEAEAAAADHSQLLPDDEDESVKSVMRHLLEASDDELGIPNGGDENGGTNSNSVQDSPFAFTDDNGLWELDDVAANYYTLLQSQLFM